MRRARSFAIAIAVASAGAWANDVTPVPDPPPIVPGDRAGYFNAVLERLSETDLKEFYLRCSREAIRGRMGAGEIALCSQGYELLLKRSFGGDFFALLEWRRGLTRSAPLVSPF